MKDRQLIVDPFRQACIILEKTVVATPEDMFSSRRLARHLHHILSFVYL